MILSLLIPWIFGAVVADRLLALREGLVKLSVGWAFGWLLALMGTNMALLGGLSLGEASATVLGLQLVLAFVFGVAQPSAGWDWSWGRWTWVFLAGGAALVHFTTNTILFLNPDDDFFLHAPLQGHMLVDLFPPRNPFFPELVYAGHYARDLITVMAAYLSGATLYGVQSPVTVGLQLGAFTLLFSALRRQTRQTMPAALGTLFVFTGVNAGFRGGWLDTVANNNALAQMIMALVIFLTLEALFGSGPRWPATIAAGISLGGLAWAYETSFACLSLGLCGLAFSTLVLRELKGQQLVTAGVIVLLTLMLGASQGGVFRHLAVKLLGGHEMTEAKVDPTLQSQNLEVSIKFPKERLFHIKLDRSGEEMSMAYTVLPLLRDIPKPSDTPGYVSVFSPYALRIHWLGLYLAPISLVMLMRRKSWSGLLLWWTGFSAYFLPSVVDFGLWEAEVFRWQYVASWGFSGGLGVAIGQWWLAQSGPLYSSTKGAFVFHRRAFLSLGLGLLVVLNTAPGFQQVVQRTAQLESLWSGALFPKTLDWLQRQPELAFSLPDARLALETRSEVQAYDRVLSSARDENLYNVYPEATFSGLFGALPIGHAYPSTFEGLGTLPFRQKAVARAFWMTKDARLLANLEPDWLVLRPPFVGTLEELPGLELVRTEEDRSLYRVSEMKLPPETPIPGLTLEKVEFPKHRLDVETACTVALTLRQASGKAWEGETRLTYEFVDMKSREPVEAWDRFSQPLDLRFEQGASVTVSTVLVTPHLQGRYRLVVRVGGEVMTMSPEILVGNRDIVSQLRIVSVRALAPVTPGTITRFQLRLKNGSTHDLVTSRPLLAAVVPKTDTSLHLVRDFQELSLNVPAGGEVEVTLPSVVPESPNGFELMIVPRDGWVVLELPALSE